MNAILELLQLFLRFNPAIQALALVALIIWLAR